jgi:hypothetical protein
MCMSSQYYWVSLSLTHLAERQDKVETTPARPLFLQTKYDY